MGFRNLSQNRKTIKTERCSFSHIKFNIKSLSTPFSSFPKKKRRRTVDKKEKYVLFCNRSQNYKKVEISEIAASALNPTKIVNPQKIRDKFICFLSRKNELN